MGNAKVGVDKPAWETAVNAANSKISNLTAPKIKGIGKNNLKRFSDWQDIRKQMNTFLIDFASYVKTDTDRMISAGDTIESQDERVANSISKTVRFK